jgi:NitT/TauT family transport system ATP-binding protein
MEPLLQVSDVSYSFQSPQAETRALNAISFSISRGEFVAIVGPSGCGKSTLLNLIEGLIQPTCGDIKFNFNNKENPVHSIGYMLQQDQLLEWRTIFENVILGLEIQKKLTKQNLSAARTLLAQYGLSDFADKHPSELSGGMRQRAALVRTLVLNPELLLLDEPFSALDYQTRLNVSDDIGTILRSNKKTALLVTHDLSEAISLADRILVLSRRPARVQKIVTPVFDSALSPMERRNDEKFKSYFNILWKELNFKNEDK